MLNKITIKKERKAKLNALKNNHGDLLCPYCRIELKRSYYAEDAFYYCRNTDCEKSAEGYSYTEEGILEEEKETEG